MDEKSGPTPRFSEDRQWWWDGSQWVPANQVPVQTWRWPNPPWAQRLVEANRKRWRWVVLPCLLAAVALAIYDLISGWEIPSSGLATLVAIGLLVFVLATCIALVVFAAEERRNVPVDAALGTGLGVAGRGIRWSSLFAIGLSVVLFANCSAAVTSGDSVTGAMSKPSQFWTQAGLEMLPLVLAFVLPAGVATAVQVLFGSGRLREATRVASLGLWSAAMIAVVAVVTAVVGLSGAAECFYVSTASACAAGVGGLMNVTAIGSLLVIVPYVVLMRRALSSAHPGPSG
jgi:hypothetical protein